MTSPTKLAAFRLDLELIEGMEQVKRETGAPVSYQVRQAIAAWLAQHGVKAKADRRRAATRKRS
jgi:predicted DNA-binding protein